MREAKAATTLQAAWRMARQRQAFQDLKTAAALAQRRWRGAVGRMEATERRRERAALRLQTIWRCHVARRSYQRIRQVLGKLQSRYRLKLAERSKRQAEEERRNIGRLQAENAELRAEIARLLPGTRPLAEFEAMEARLQQLDQTVATLEEERRHRAAEISDLTEKLSVTQVKSASLEAHMAPDQFDFLLSSIQNRASRDSPVFSEPEEEEGELQAEEAGEEQSSTSDMVPFFFLSSGA